MDNILLNWQRFKIKEVKVKKTSTRQRPTFPQVKPAVLSAKRGLASGFGMGPGVSLSL